MTKKTHIATAATIVALFGFACLAQAEVVVEYELRANGMATGSGVGGGIAPADLGLGPAGGTFQLEIWSKVSNNTCNVDGTDYDLGLLQYSVDIYDSSGNARDASDALIPTEKTAYGVSTTFWKSSSTSPLVNYSGQVVFGSPRPEDVLGQTGAVPPGDWMMTLTTISANEWSKVGEGEYTWDGTEAVTLTLDGVRNGTVVAQFPAEPSSPGGPLTYGVILNDSNASFVGDTITFAQAIPEPSTIAMLLVGALGLLLHTRRRK